MQKQTRYLDLLSPVGFLELFGNESNKEILLAFLNTMLKGRTTIGDIKCYVSAPSKLEKGIDGTALILICSGPGGERFLVLLVYLNKYVEWARFMSGVLGFTFSFNNHPLNDVKNVPVFAIGLGNYQTPGFLDGHREDEYIVRSVIEEIRNHPSSADKVFEDNINTAVDIETAMVELPRFNKAEKELNTDVDRWLFLLRNLGGMNEIPSSLNKEIFSKVFEASGRRKKR